VFISASLCVYSSQLDHSQRLDETGRRHARRRPQRAAD